MSSQLLLNLFTDPDPFLLQCFCSSSTLFITAEFFHLTVSSFSVKQFSLKLLQVSYTGTSVLQFSATNSPFNLMLHLKLMSSKKFYNSTMNGFVLLKDFFPSWDLQPLAEKKDFVFVVTNSAFKALSTGSRL